MVGVFVRDAVCAEASNAPVHLDIDFLSSFTSWTVNLPQKNCPYFPQQTVLKRMVQSLDAFYTEVTTAIRKAEPKCCCHNEINQSMLNKPKEIHPCIHNYRPNSA